MQVVPGVFQFKVPMPINPMVPDGGIRYTLVYALSVPDGRWVVIDAGMNTDDGFQAFQDQLSGAGIPAGDVALILITHAHPDHAGLANRIKEFTGAQVAMHRLDAPGDHTSSDRWSDRDSSRRLTEWYGFPSQDLDQAFHHGPPSGGGSKKEESGYRGVRWESPRVDLRLEGGEELLPGSGLWAVWTPGHTPGHLCVHDAPRRLFFSGDHILPTISPHVSLYPGENDDPLSRYISSLEGLRDVDVDTVYPAHEHSFPGLRERVEELLGHHQQRLQEIIDQVADGPRTPYQISAGITWNVAPWDQLNPSTRRMALLETIAHLKHLEDAGRLARRETDAALLYTAPTDR